jgi:hypothetical protein
MNVNLEVVTTGPVSRTGVLDRRLPAPLDIAHALDLVVAAADHCGHDDGLQPRSRSNIGGGMTGYAHSGEPRGIVGHALSIANVGVADLESMRDQSLRQLYRDGRLPIPITLGALVVLDAAQRSQDRGHQPDEVLDDAASAAARFLDLVSVLPAASGQVRSVLARPRGGRLRLGGRTSSLRNPTSRWGLLKESSCRFTRAI